jgi:hypothetical protein
MSEPGNPANNGDNAPCVLAAHAAARAMARRGARLMQRRSLPRSARSAGAACCRRPAWTPLLLRWARKPVAGRSGGAMRAPALPARPGAVFHWYLHLALLSGSDRAQREARTAALAGPLRTRAQASPINRPGAGRLADPGYRRRGGPTSTIEAGGAIRPGPQPASILPVRFAALAHSARADAWKASNPLRIERTWYKCRWLGRAALHARWVRGDSAGRPAQLPHAPKGQSPRIRAPLLSGAPALGQTRVAHPGAVRGERLAWPLMAPRSPISAPAAMIPSRRSPKDFLRRTRSQETRTLLREKRATPAPRAFDSARAPAAKRPHGEKVLRASDTAPAATDTSRRIALSRTAANSAVRRPLDLVWPASAASAAAPGHAQRVGAAGGGDLPCARAMQAIAQAPAAISPPRVSSVVRADALDPVLANRLADEVMRRIDHRARIARERRGL